MAFNPLHTFQKNRRFWMAAILMICMVSFVFCTGMKGDMAERFGWMIGSRGTPIAVVAGRNVTSTQLHDLKAQRQVANEFMRNCNDIAFKNVSKIMFEEDRKQDKKDDAARKQMLAQLEDIRQTLFDRKSRPRYFDIGVKFDDLIEFKLWQAVADKLEIKLDDEHIAALFRFEFFSSNILTETDVGRAQNDARRNHQNATDAYIRRAITEEFRVRIAQEAVLTAQPLQLYSARRQGQGQGFGMKLTDSRVPEETRAPLTLAQLWEAYKKQRAEFNVTLLPVSVQDLLKEIKEEPTDGQKAEYFRTHKDRLADPSAEDRGLQLPIRVKVEYAMADPSSKQYLGLAKTVAQLRATNPIHLGAVESPLGAAVSAMAQAQLQRMDVEKQYEVRTKPSDRFDYRGTPFSVRGAAAPIMTWLAKRHPEAIASMIGNGFAGPTADFSALASYMAWGALKHPDELEASMKAEAERRAPHYASLVAFAGADPLQAVVPFFRLGSERDVPPLPVEAVRHEIEEILARQEAEEWAQQNMQTLRAALEKADGDPEKYKRVLTKLVPELNLTYGPEKKTAYVNRFSVNDVKELEPLKQAFLKYMDRINFFEGRDLTPERLLKDQDFQKLFFDSSENFAGIAPYHAMPWPPMTKTSNTRVLKPFADPRLIDPKNLDGKDFANFHQQLGKADPLRPAVEFDMFKHAEKPILFWRTAERIPVRPNDYNDIERDLKKFAADWTKIDQEAKKLEEVTTQYTQLRKQLAELKKAKKDDAAAKLATEIAAVNASKRKLEKEAGGSAEALRSRQTDLKEKEADLEETKRLIVEGWKFERAREKALPKAQEVALEFLKDLPKTKSQIAEEQAAKLGRERILLPLLAPMSPEPLPDMSVDYFKPRVPKDKIPFPRDDMMDHAVRLYDLKDAIKIDSKELDEINKMLYDKARAANNPQGEFVQILTNKPRSEYYVAVVTLPPRAEPIQFMLTMKGIDNILLTGNQPRNPLTPRDHFAERIQQQDAKIYRANVIAWFKETAGPLGRFELLKADAAKEFDERGAGE